MRQIYWKSFIGPAHDDTPTRYTGDSFNSRGVGFLGQIAAMPKKKPLSWEASVVLYAEAVLHIMMEKDGRLAARWINEAGGFLGCVSQMGFHITLRGDEYVLK
jgi:hypothetical protein